MEEVKKMEGNIRERETEGDGKKIAEKRGRRGPRKKITVRNVE